MTEQQPQKEEVKEEKSQAQLDYEAGQEFLKNLEPAQAANAFHNALIAFELEGNENGIANAADKLGDICAKRGDLTMAFSHYDRVYAICQKHTDRFSLFSIEKKKAKLMYEAKEYDQAIRLYNEVLDEYGALRNPQGSVDTLEILAEIYLAKGEKNKAADAYRTIAAIHQSFKHSRHAGKFLQKAAETEKG
jgi:tetratricopeptide (TPR) repeat protein